jgi:tRNA 2-thiocytidine biosynthesis protein TtcA
MMDEWEKASPGRIEQVFKSLRNVAPSQLADPRLFDFISLGSSGSTPAAANWLVPEAGD